MDSSSVLNLFKTRENIKKLQIWAVWRTQYCRLLCVTVSTGHNFLLRFSDCCDLFPLLIVFVFTSSYTVHNGSKLKEPISKRDVTNNFVCLTFGIEHYTVCLVIRQFRILISYILKRVSELI